MTLQLPELSVHGDPMNLPVAGSEVLKETVPEGLYPDSTSAVHVVVDPTVSDWHDAYAVGVALLTLSVVFPWE